MARLKPIRITQNDRAEYAKLAKNTKAKLARTTKNYGIDLSAEISVPKLEDFSTRDEYNEWKQKASSFTNRNNLHYQFKKNEFGVVASKARIGKIERENRRAIDIAKRKEKEMQNKPFISGGKVQGTVGERMAYMGRPNMAGITVPKKFDFNEIRNQDRLNTVEQNMERRSDVTYFDKRMETMKARYIESLMDFFNSDANDLAEKLRNMPADDFYEMYLKYDEFDFDVFYPMEGVETSSHDHIVKRLESYVERYYQGDENLDLKPFRNRKGG